MEDEKISPIGDSWEDVKKEIEEYIYGKLKWGYELTENKDRFLLGFHIDIGKYDDEGIYGNITIYLGFWSISIGKDYFH